MTSRHRLAAALDKVFPHLLILLYSLGAAVIYYHHWPFHPSRGLRYIAPPWRDLYLTPDPNISWSGARGRPREITPSKCCNLTKPLNKETLA